MTNSGKLRGQAPLSPKRRLLPRRGQRSLSPGFEEPDMSYAATQDRTALAFLGVSAVNMSLPSN